MQRSVESQTLLAHEWIAPRGGSENVFEALTEAVPHSRALCLWDDSIDRFKGRVDESWLAKTPLRHTKIGALPVEPVVWRTISLGEYDSVVVSSHAFAHHLASRAANCGLNAFAYVHTPARYVWAPEQDRRGQAAVARFGRSALMRLDRRSTDERVHYAANSKYISERIERVWGQPSRVIYPPVAVNEIQRVQDWSSNLKGTDEQIVAALPSDFILGASRLVPYKRLDDVIRVAAVLGVGAVIAGSGPDQHRLEAFAHERRVPTQFLGGVSDELLYALYQRANLFVFMGIEDFGIMPAEAIAAGTPVLVNAEGGASEIVEATDGGVALSSATSEERDLAAAVEAALSSDMKFAAERVGKFDRDSFRSNIRDWTGL